MSQIADIEYAPAIRGFMVLMPKQIGLTTIDDLGKRLYAARGPEEGRRYNLLLDSNLHQFESIACLKALRDILEAPRFAEKFARIAFVTPAQFREPHIASEQEGYFDTVDAACDWLRAHE